MYTTAYSHVYINTHTHTHTHVHSPSSAVSDDTETVMTTGTDCSSGTDILMTSSSPSVRITASLVDVELLGNNNSTPPTGGEGGGVNKKHINITDYVQGVKIVAHY